MTQDVMQPQLSSSRTLLLIEEDADLSRPLTSYFASHGWSVTTTDHLEMSLRHIRTGRYSVVVLDSPIGHDDGMELVKEIGVRGGPPVVVVSARSDEADRVLALELGAEDYILKPFSFRELLARVHVALRRRRAAPSPVGPPMRLARFGSWTVDLAASAIRDESGRMVDLTSAEFAVLRAFLDNPGRVLRRRELLALTRSTDADVLDRAIDVFVARLRRKLEPIPKRPMFIKTIRGQGYRFTHTVSWDLEVA